MALCRNRAKNVVSISKLVMNEDLKLLQRCLRKKAILDVAHEYEWIMHLVKKDYHELVTSIHKGNFSTMTYRKSFSGVARAREFANR